MPSLSSPLASLVARARSWPVDSQQVARRNAMVACTALAARRAEREEVDEFMAGVRVDAAVAARRVAARG
jgi:hypothetical protein